MKDEAAAESAMKTKATKDKGHRKRGFKTRDMGHRTRLYDNDDDDDNDDSGM